MTNPLLEARELPAFGNIEVSEIEPTLRNILDNNLNTINQLLEKETTFTWESLVDPMDALEDKLDHLWSPISHLHAVMNNDALREVYEKCLPQLSAYATKIGQNEALYQAYKDISERKDFRRLSVAQRKTVKDALRDFRLSGVTLSRADKESLKAVQEKLSMLSNQFSNHVLDATGAWHYHTEDKADLAGLPEHTLEAAGKKAKEEGHSGYCLGLDAPTFQAVMTYADNGDLRKACYEAYTTRASDQGPHANRWDNTPIMDEILALRHQKAKLLGFNNYAEYSIETKMAQSTSQVESFLEGLADCAHPYAKAELAELEAFAGRALDVWDIGYYSEKLRQQSFEISQEALRPYFPTEHVFSGLFDLLTHIFDITITPREGVDTWHEDVRFFDVFGPNGERRGGFYVDLYARSKKRNGAWMDECRVRRIREDRSTQLPVAYLVCDFAPAVGDKPAMLTHAEVETLFHEMGHTMHHVLTQVDYPAVSGINGVAWDAVELPSQFLENFCWQPEVIKMISKHYETGEPLPTDKLDKLRATKTFQAGMQMLKQVEFSLFDFRIHCYYNADNPEAIQQVLEQVRKEVAIVIPPDFNRFQNTFGHIFAGGYAAGYYSYKWAEVLSSDAFSRFEETGIFDKESGRAFRETILENGGSRDPLELFVKFRGREPDINALLRHSGLIDT